MVINEIGGILSSFEENIGGNIIPFVNEILPYTRSFAAALMTTLVGYKVIVYMVNPSDRLDPYILVRPILILAALLFYEKLVDLLLYTPMGFVTNIIGKASQSSGLGLSLNLSDLGTSFVEMSFFGNPVDVMSEVLEFPDIDIHRGGKIWKLLNVLGGIILNAAQAAVFAAIGPVIGVILNVIAKVIIWYMLFRLLIVKSIYYILGTFALPFSLVPGNKRVLGKWFFGFVSILLWHPLLLIINFLVNEVSENSSSGLVSIVLQIVLIVIILQVPRLANILVSQGAEFGGGKDDGGIIAPAKAAGRKAAMVVTKGASKASGALRK